MAEEIPIIELDESDIPEDVRKRARAQALGIQGGPLVEAISPAAPQGAPGGLGRFLGQVGIGAGATAAGMGVGGLLGGPPGAIAGGILFGGASPILAQKLGLQKDVTGLDVLLGAIPAPGAAAGRATTRALVPGVEAGIQQGVVKGVQAGAGVTPGPLASRFLPATRGGEIVPRGPFGPPVTRLRPPQPLESSTLYAEAERLAPGVRISTTKVADTAQALIKKEAGVVKPLRITGVEKARKAAEEVSFGQSMNLMDFNTNTKRVGALFREAKDVFERTGEGGERVRALGKVYGSMIDALDDAAKTQKGQPAITALRRANEAFKRELFADELQGLITKAIQPVGGQPGFNADAVLRHLLPGQPVGEMFLKLVSPGEIKDLTRTLKVIAAGAPRTLETVAGPGAMSFPKRALVQGGIGALGFSIGGASGAVGGVIATEALFRLLATAPGRALARGIAGSPRLTGPLAPSVYDQLVNAGMATARAQMVNVREAQSSEK